MPHARDAGATDGFFAVMAEANDAAAALARGIHFLERSQLPSGELRVFAGDTQDPAVFPTALISYSLSFAPAASRVHARALDFLAAEMDGRGLWKHWPRAHPQHQQLPPDLDDTACASAALRRAGRAVPPNEQLLLRNRNRRGLFYTWKLGAAQLRHPLATFLFFRMTSARPFDIDAVVNANVSFYLGPRPAIHPVIEHLLNVLRENRESSCDKWYENPFAIWYFFSRALCDIAPEARELIAGKLRAARPKNALECALAACTALNVNQPPAIDALLTQQLASGAWPAAPLYHGGRRRRRDGSFDAPHPDTPQWGSEELTTAFCVEALARVLQAT
jgi:hypothetical protein